MSGREYTECTAKHSTTKKAHYLILTVSVAFGLYGMSTRPARMLDAMPKMLMILGAKNMGILVTSQHQYGLSSGSKMVLPELKYWCSPIFFSWLLLRKVAIWKKQLGFSSRRWCLFCIFLALFIENKS